jgi:tubulin-folding cofactor B
VIDLRPPGLRENYTDVSSTTKWVLPTEEYEKKEDSVLAWKKREQRGRFDPNAPTILEKKIAAYDQEIHERGIEVGKRCRVGEDDSRRGEVMYVGDVEEIPGSAGKWIGVKLDEPVGKNDGSIGGKRYWGKEGDAKFGVFVRPERVTVGDFPPMDDLLEDMEEI